MFKNIKNYDCSLMGSLFSNTQTFKHVNWNKINKNFYNSIESFEGIFDGNNFKIKNIKINSNYQDKYIGFFDLYQKFLGCLF